MDRYIYMEVKNEMKPSYPSLYCAAFRHDNMIIMPSACLTLKSNKQPESREKSVPSSKTAELKDYM